MVSMRRATALALVVVALGAVACSGFGSEEETGTPTSDDGGVPDGANPPVGGEPSRGITVTAGEAGKTVFVIQSRATDVPIKVERRDSSIGPVAITVGKLPAGATADPLTIPAGANEGTLTLHAAATTPQGAVTLDITALETVESGSGSSAKLVAFVRGRPGTVDTTFGTAGFFRKVFESATSGASDARVLKDGSIIVAGHRTNNRALTRITPLGVRDTKFAGSGITNLGTGQGSVFLDVYEATPAAGSFICAIAYGPPPAPPLFRTNAAGAADTTFNGNGTAPVSLGLGNALGSQTIALPDGKCLALTAHFSAKAAVVSRWKTDGTLDATYGTAGQCRLTATGAGSDVTGANRMLLRPNGGVQVVMSLATSGAALQGCTADGILDPTIGTAPDHFLSFPGGEAVRGVDGGIVWLGSTSWGRMNAALVSDTGPGNFGTVPVTPLATAYGLVAQADGGVVIAGEPTTPTGGTITVVRYTANGFLDPDFGDAGSSTIVVGTNTFAFSRIVAQPDGRILLLGTSDDTFDGVIARIWP